MRFGTGPLQARPSRDFVPAAASLSCARQKMSNVLEERRSQSAPVPSPLRCAAGSPAMLATQGSRGTHFATLRSNSRAKSVNEARCARALGRCASRLLQRGTPEQPQQPTAKPESRLAPAARYAPFSTAEQRRILRPCAQRTSTSDSAQLFEQSVAARVLRGASRSEQRREPAAQRRAVRSGGALCLLSGGPESKSPAGAKSRHHTRQQTKGSEA
jgi:hypothetical protein